MVRGVVLGNVQEMHSLPENNGAVFMVASQLNCLEMVSPTVTPEKGITRYQWVRSKTDGAGVSVSDDDDDDDNDNDMMIMIMSSPGCNPRPSMRYRRSRRNLLPQLPRQWHRPGASPPNQHTGRH